MCSGLKVQRTNSQQLGSMKLKYDCTADCVATKVHVVAVPLERWLLNPAHTMQGVINDLPTSESATIACTQSVLGVPYNL